MKQSRNAAIAGVFALAAAGAAQAAPLMMSAEWAMCSWFATKAPDERPATDTCAGSTGKAPSLSAASADAPQASTSAAASQANRFILNISTFPQRRFAATVSGRGAMLRAKSRFAIR